MSEIQLTREENKPWSYFMLKQEAVYEVNEEGKTVMEDFIDEDEKDGKRPKVKLPEQVSIHKGFDTAVKKVKEYISEGIPAPKIMLAEVTIEMDDKATTIKATQIPWSVLFEKAFR